VDGSLHKAMLTTQTQANVVIKTYQIRLMLVKINKNLNRHRPNK